MPKLRNATTDLGKLAQWMARKCRNHHPLHELSLNTSTREGLPAQHAHGMKKGEVFAVDGHEDLIVYRAGGRNFMLKLTEISEEQVAEIGTLQAVGF